jgi:hypothetical protein
MFLLTNRCDLPVGGGAESLLSDGGHLMSGRTEEMRAACPEIFLEFHPHAESPTGRSA